MNLKKNSGNQTALMEKLIARGDFKKAFDVLEEQLQHLKSEPINIAEGKRLLFRLFKCCNILLPTYSASVSLPEKMSRACLHVTDLLRVLIKQGASFTSKEAAQIFSLNRIFLHADSLIARQDFMKVCDAGLQSGQLAFAGVGRISNLRKITRKQPKIAVIVAGQIRGWKDASKSIQHFLEGTDSDVFLQTWEKSGFRRITISPESHPHLFRTFPDTFCHFLIKNNINPDALMESLPNFRSTLIAPVNADILKEAFGARLVAVKQEQNCMLQFTKQANDLASKYSWLKILHADPVVMFKMLYARWLGNQLAFRYAAENSVSYDYKVFLRPDCLIDTGKHNLAGILENYNLSTDEIIVDDHDPNLEVVSDYLAIGRPSAMDCYFNQWERLLHPDFTAWLASCPQRPHLRLPDNLLLDGLRLRYVKGLRNGFDESTRVSTDVLIAALGKDLESEAVTKTLAKPSYDALVRFVADETRR